MDLSLAMVTCDAVDPVGLGRWWADRTGGALEDAFGGEFALVRGGGLPVVLAFQRVEHPSPGKNRLHLDLTADDVEATVAELAEAGAELVGRRGEAEMSWVTLRDPAGNEFCVAPTGHHDDP